MTATRDVGRAFLAALPRFALALVVAFLIAEPLLLIVFRDEIDSEVGKIRTELAAEAERGVRDGRRDRLEQLQKPTMIDQDNDGVNDIQTAEKDLKRVQDEIDKVDRQIDANSRLLDQETLQGVVRVAGRRTSGIAGCGPRCRELEAAIQLDQDRRTHLRERERQFKERLRTLRGETAEDEAARTADLRDLNREQTTLGQNADSTFVVADPRLNGSQITIDWEDGVGWVVKER